MTQKHTLRNMLLAFLLNLSIGGVVALGEHQLLKNEENAPRLPGSSISVREATASANLIAIGTIVNLDVQPPSAPGRVYYRAEMRIKDAIKGAPRTDIAFMLVVRVLQMSERAPNENEQYIAFLVNGKSNVDAIKLLDASTENITAVKAELRPSR